MKRAVAVSALVAVLAAAALVYLGRPEPETISEPVPAGGVSPFGRDGRVESGAFRARFNGTGSRLAVLTQAGIGIVERGDIRVLEGTAEAADFAWLQDGRHLLVADGGGRVGRLRVIDLDGRQSGVVPLGASLAFGHGLSVDGAGRSAVAAVEVRAGAGQRHVHLVHLDLRSGAVTELTSPEGEDETGPFHVDDRTVAFTGETTPARPMQLEVASRSVKEVAETGRVIGATRGGIALLVEVSDPDGSRAVVELAARPGSRLALEQGETALAVSPTTPVVVVSEADRRLSRRVLGG